MDDKRDVKKKEKKRSRSRSRDNKRRSPSRSPSYGRRRRERSRSRDRVRRRSRSPVEMRRRGGRGRRSPSPPPPPSMHAPPPPMIAGGVVPPAGYGGLYDAYGGYATGSAPAPYLGEMGQAYGGYGEYRAPPGPAPVAVDGYGGMLSGPPPQIMMAGQPGPPGEEYGAAAAAATGSGWNAPPPALPVPQETEEEKRKREAAIASEVRNQRASLKKQRDDYQQRAGALKRELKILKQQRADLSSGREPPSPTTNSFIKENDKLQSQIQTKLSTIENVIDMLEGIIGKDKTPTPPPPVLSAKTPERTSTTDDSPAAGRRKERKESVSSSASPERLKNEVLETMKRAKSRKEEKTLIKQEKLEDSKSTASSTASAAAAAASTVNHVFYDPELHWCSVCDIFPKTAKDYLNHLHTEQHAAKVAASSQEYPWRDKLPETESEPPNNPALPPKRVPIRGLQFFVPAPAWYCKLCNHWMGDLHCASLHLKSGRHRESYAQFIDGHANFEIDWMSDRQKAYERMRDSDRGVAASTTDSGPNDFLTAGLMPKDGVKGKKKSKKEEKKDKKKKKRSKKKKKRAASSSSSSSSSDSDSDPEKKSSKGGDEFDPATSIRVAMRNLLKAQEAASKEAKPAAAGVGEETAVAGKWTVVQTAAVVPKELTAPPPPFMTEGAESREKKRDELMISQWVTPEPIISEKEKQMLEQLKGKLKKRDEGPPPPLPPQPRSPPSGGGRFRESEGDHFHREMDDRRRSKSVTPPWRRGNRSPVGRRGSPFGRGGRRSPPDHRGRDRSPMGGRMRDRSMDRRRDRSMDRGGRDRSLERGRRDRSMDRGGRDRGSRDRDLNRGGGFGGRFDRRRDRRSPSPAFVRPRFRSRRSFSRSRSRSRSRGRRVIEKPVVNFPPEPKPKPAKKPRESKKDEDKKDKKPVSMSISGQKKLPFIGRMPVFKKQQQDAKKEEPTSTEHPDVEHPEGQENGTKSQPEEFGDMMPDPYQYVALMGAPPPPPTNHPSKPDQNILPPGIDEAEADLVPKPISDAPIPRKGPLPKDFQQALDILFDGDKPKPADIIANETKPQELPPPPPPAPIIDTDQPEMIVPEAIEIYNQQIAAQYSTAVVSGAAISYDDESQNQPLEMKPTKSKSPVDPQKHADDNNTESTNGTVEVKVEPPEPAAPAPAAKPKVEVENEETRRKRAELEELAMLGIDADDMAAQIF